MRNRISRSGVLIRNIGFAFLTRAIPCWRIGILEGVTFNALRERVNATMKILQSKDRIRSAPILFQVDDSRHA